MSSSITSAGDCFVVLAPFAESNSVIVGRNSLVAGVAAAADEPSSEVQYFAATTNEPETVQKVSQ